MRSSYTRGVLALLAATVLGLSAAPAGAEAPISPETGGEAAGPGEEALPEGDEGDDGAAAAPDPLFDEDWQEAAAPAFNDPLEPGNRAVLRFNEGVDRFFWTPVTAGYRMVLPGPARRSVRRVFRNLSTPVYLVNHLLQLRFRDAGETFGAFAVDSAFGLGGVLDASGAALLERRPADFGQTLAVHGVASGPYLMLPALGPTTVRDGVGGVVDFFLHPLTYFLGAPVLAVGYGSAGLARREAVADQLDALQESSLDYYAVLRSAYLQAREESIREARRRADLKLYAPDVGAGPATVRTGL